MNMIMRITTWLVVFSAAGVSLPVQAQWRKVGTVGDEVVTSIYANEGVLFAGTSVVAGIFRSMDNGESWRSDDNPRTAVSHLIAFGRYLLASSTSTRMLRSTDNGLTWSSADVGLGGIRATTLAVSDSVILCGTINDGIFRSMDSGSSWTKANTGGVSGGIGTLVKYNGYLFAGGSGILRTSNNGDHWTRLAIGESYFMQIYAIAGIDSILYAGASDYGLFRSTDNGDNWTRVETMRDYVRDLLTVGTQMLAGTYGAGVLRSIDSGISWTPLNDGLPAYLQVRCLAVSDGALFVAAGNTIWKRSLSELAGVVDDRSTRWNTSDRVSIYPNPVSAYTTIRYTLDVRSAVTITIHDVSGRTVARLVSGEIYERGEHAVTLDALELPSGIYSCHISADRVDMSARIVVAR